MAPLTYSTRCTWCRERGAWLEDVDGRRYLDAYNNVPVVGHAHPRVANAIAEQARELNTNLRYLHPSAIEARGRLIASMPAGSGLDTVLFVNAGSEATDLAWRLATTATGNEGGIVSANAYHGVTTTTTALSPEEWRDGLGPLTSSRSSRPTRIGRRSQTARPSARLSSAWTRAASGRRRSSSSRVHERRGAGSSDGVLRRDRPSRATLARSSSPTRSRPGTAARASTCGRSSRARLEPDLVTLGKPMGNGHPLAAVIARRTDVDRLAERAEFFSTFGGNPVAAAAGNAVLDVIRDERLIEHAAEVGAHLRRGLDRLAERHESIGDVRNLGLLLGVELVRDRASREPDGETRRGRSTACAIAAC